MKGRRFSPGLLTLPLVMMMWAAAAGTEESETPLFGPEIWSRVDGQDHYLDEMLSLLRPPQAETLAIFAPPKSWKPFYDKIYGRAPVNLAHYAAIYRLLPAEPDSPSLDAWPSFYLDPTADTAYPEEQPDPAAVAPTGELLDTPSPTMVTFKTTVLLEDGRQGGRKESKTTYTVIVSIISTGRQICFLNLFQANLDDSTELERLALDWRMNFLETNVLTEETFE
jgi:hypothetical protein